MESNALKVNQAPKRIPMTKQAPQAVLAWMTHAQIS